MEKAVKWQIPFSTADVQNPTYYRIDIYADDDGSWDHNDPTQLTAGKQPFVTDEDSDEDLFAPIRTQTGSIQVCTLKPDSTMLTLDEILPANNIDHPVRLLNITDANNPVIEWQGFLSCEAYSQNYNSIPENLTLSIISVLEAMDSVQLDQTRSSGLTSIVQATFNVLNEIVVQSGMTFYSHVNYSMTTWRIFNKFIDQTIFFEQKEYDNENSTTYIVSGLSAKEALERLCKFMGWIAREQGTELYLAYIGEKIGMYQEEYHWFDAHILRPDQDGTPSRPITIGEIANLVWRGIDHQRDIRQGAKSVEVVAKLEKYNLNIEIPECPVGSLVEQYRQLWNNGTTYGDWLYLLANSNVNAYSHMSVAYFSALGGLSGNNWVYQNYAQTTLADVLDHIATGPNSSAVYMWHLLHNGATWCAGAFLCKYDWESTGTATAHATANALYCAFFPLSLAASSEVLVLDPDFDPSQVGSIFSINSIVNFRASNGYIRLSANADSVYWYDAGFTGQTVTHSNNINNEWGIALELSVGGKWWNGSSWQSSQCYFFARMTKGGFKSNWEETMPITKTDGLLIPVNTTVQGIVNLKIWPMASNLASDSGTQFAHSSLMEMIFSQLSVDYVPPMNSNLTDRSENHYFRLLGTNFRDEISVSTDLASMLNNQPSPSLIMDDATTPASSIDYTVSGGTESRRPEVDLLNRLAAYYGASRQRLELIVKHPTGALLPLLKLNGINDGKVYLPLAESRDWRQEVSTLTCFEVPEEQPSES